MHHAAHYRGGGFRQGWKPLALLTLWLLAVASPATAIIGLFERNWTGHLTATDSDWFYKNLDGTYNSEGEGYYPPLEYESGRSFQITKVAYVKGSTAAIHLTFHSIYMAALNCHLRVTGARLIVPAPPGGGSSTTVNLTVTGDNTGFTLPVNGSQEVDFAVDVPGNVTLGEVQFLVYVLKDGQGILWGSDTNWQTWETLYSVYATPVGLQTIPWTDLLEYSCWWAEGEDDNESVASDITHYMYWDTNWTYDGTGTWHWPTSDTYNLTFAVNQSRPNMDCRDVAGFVYLAMQSQGLSSTMKRLADQGGIGFLTNNIVPIGCASYEVADWDYHVVVDYSGIYDACLAMKLDLDGNAYDDAAYGWILGDYWQLPVGGGVYYGLVSCLRGSTTPETVSCDPTTRAMAHIQ